MRVLYFDCIQGISGKLALGALLNLGVDTGFFQAELHKLRLRQESCLCIEEKIVNGLVGTSINIACGSCGRDESGGEQCVFSFGEVEKNIVESALKAEVKGRSLEMLQILVQAEAKSGLREEQDQLQVAADTLLEIIGTAICLDTLKIEKIIASPVKLGRYNYRAAEILKRVPVILGKEQYEATTASGAVILKANATDFSEETEINIERIGYGVTENNSGAIRIFRTILGEITVPEELQLTAKSKLWIDECQWMLETNIDDMNPEIYEHVEGRLFLAGALDVYKVPIIMKKSRPAVKLCVLCRQENVEILKRIIFLETSAIGIRSYRVKKSMLERISRQIETVHGPVTVKFSFLEGRMIHYKPEYDDCKRIAMQNDIPLTEVYRQVAEQLINSKE